MSTIMTSLKQRENNVRDSTPQTAGSRQHSLFAVLGWYYIVLYLLSANGDSEATTGVMLAAMQIVDEQEKTCEKRGEDETASDMLELIGSSPSTRVIHLSAVNLKNKTPTNEGGRREGGERPHA